VIGGSVNEDLALSSNLLRQNVYFTKRLVLKH
jgi:hypothetical protein